MKLSELFEKRHVKKAKSKKENEEIAAVVKTPPINQKGSYMGGETGTAGKNHPTVSYLGKSTGKAYDSTGMLGAG